MSLQFIRGTVAPLFSYIWGSNPNLSSAMSAPTRRHHGNGFITRLTIVGLVGICLIALGALVACPTEDESESSDAILSALTLSDGTTNVPLMPDFASDTTIYTASVDNSVESVTITATTTDGGATLTIAGASTTSGTASGAIELTAGDDTRIVIVVTTEDAATTKTYTITVTRLEASDTTAPTFTVVPADTATGVAVDADIVITANEPIRMTGGAEITNGTVAGLITLMETPSGSSSAAVKPFTATINTAKRILTIDPTDDFASEASVSVSLAQVEDEAGNDSENPAIAATFTVVPMIIDISGRTQAVQDAIVATSEVTATDRAAIPSEQLAAITSLTVSGVSSLMADDFASLSGLTELDLGGNSGLTTLPSGIFDDLLDTLTTLTLDTALQGTVEFATASGDIAQGVTVALSVTLTTALPTAVQIPYAVAFGGAGPADAADFSGLADGMVTFAAGSMAAQSIAVTATATADVGGTATLTLGTPILTADTRAPSPLAASSLVSVGSGRLHTLTVIPAPSATLSVTDDSVTEEAAEGSPGRAAVFTLALANLPTDGVDDASVFFTVSGFAGPIGSDNTSVTRLQAFATTTGSNVGVGPSIGETTGAGRIELSQPGSDGDIAVDGRSTAIFQLILQKDDGNIVDETIILTINCVARSRTGSGQAGCTNAGAGTILVAQEAVGGTHPASVIGDDDDPFERLPEQDFTLAAGNAIPWGIWSNGTTMWVTDSAADKIFAYNLTTKARDSSKDFDTLDAAGNNTPIGIWSNNTTMWVVNNGSGAGDKIFAYNLTTKARDPGRDFDTLAAGANHLGIWSNGTTMWVTDFDTAKIFAYDLTTKARDSGKDFDTLNAAVNSFPRGLWSDGTTMWVANDGIETLHKIFAYNLTSKARDSGKDFDTLNAAGNNTPIGIWSDGTTMWVADSVADKIFAYRMPPTEE